MLKLNDGRSELFQYDTGRTLAVDDDCSQVHFSNKVFGRSIDVDVIDGVAIIPDILLQTDKELNVWAFVGTAENGYTKISKTFKINRRNKPADYVFTPVEQTTIAEIAAIAQSVRDDADAGLFDGKPGENGTDGYSPSANVTQNDNGATITITDKNGTTTATVTNGRDGQPGADGNNGQDGSDGVGIQSVVQTTTSTEDGGTNVVTVTKTDGTSSTFAVRNGRRGSVGLAGADGKDGAPGADGKTPEYGVDYGTPEQIQGIAQSAAEILQPEVNHLRSDISANKSELDRTNSYLDALFKLNKGQIYDVLEQESEAYSVDVPSGSHYVGVDMVGGKSVAWNQLIDNVANLTLKSDYSTITKNIADNSLTLTGTVQATKYTYVLFDHTPIVKNHVYLLGAYVENVNGDAPKIIWGKASNNDSKSNVTFVNKSYAFIMSKVVDEVNGCPIIGGNWNNAGETVSLKFKNNMLFDLTQMFGSTIADYIYSLEQSQAGAGVAWFKKLFPNDYYPYSEPTIISSQTDRVDVASADSAVTQQITTGFPVLNSAGSAYDYIDLNEGKLHQRVGVVDLGTLSWVVDITGRFYATLSEIAKPTGSYDTKANLLCNRYDNITQNQVFAGTKGIATQSLRGISVYVYDSTYTDAATFKSAMQGVMLYYELAEEIITDIEIPTELSDWLKVEAGGSVTFHNTDEGKRLLIPNKLSFIRKLDEVSV